MTTASTALLTDHYELTMVQAALRAGTAHRRSVFELFPRRLPEGRRYGVVAGVGRALDAFERFRFDDEVLEVLRTHHVVDEPTLAAAHRLAHDHTTIDVCPTGTAGLAGVLALRASGAGLGGEKLVVLFTGETRG